MEQSWLVGRTCLREGQVWGDGGDEIRVSGIFMRGGGGQYDV